eukprot:4655943-Amphidinium_carterae.1
MKGHHGDRGVSATHHPHVACHSASRVLPRFGPRRQHRIEAAWQSIPRLQHRPAVHCVSSIRGA